MIRTTALVAAMAILLAWFGPSLDDHSAEFEQAADLQYAINQAIAQEKFAQAAQAVCGPQSPWTEPAPGVVQCHTKHGRKTVIAKGVTP